MAISRENFLKLKELNGEQWREMVQASIEAMTEVQNAFYQKLMCITKLKKNRTKSSMSELAQGLMDEMLWGKPPTTVEYFALQKHMQAIPELQGKKVSELRREDNEILNRSDVHQMLKLKPATHVAY